MEPTNPNNIQPQNPQGTIPQSPLQPMQQPVPETSNPIASQAQVNPAMSIPPQDPSIQPLPQVPPMAENPMVQAPTMSVPGESPIPTMQQDAAQNLMTQTGGGSSKKKLIFLILGIVVLLAIAGTLYMFVFKKQPAEPVSVTIPSPTQIPENQNLVQQEVGETPEEQEVIDIQDQSIDTDFESVDKDLQQL